VWVWDGFSIEGVGFFWWRGLSPRLACLEAGGPEKEEWGTVVSHGRAGIGA